MKYALLAFVLLALAQLFVPAKMAYDAQAVVREGTLYKFKCAPRDPAHPLKGRYVDLQFDENSFTTDTEYYTQMLFVELGTDAMGFAKIKNLYSEKPSVSDYITVPNSSRPSFVEIDKGLEPVSFTYFIQYPFEQFFMEESKAPIAEEVYRNALRDSSSQTYALVRVLNGSAVLEDVQINGVSLTELSVPEQ